MTRWLQVGGALTVAALIWVVSAAQVPGHEKLALTEIVPGAVLTQPFGCTNLALEPIDPFCPGRHLHTGIDLAAPEGTTVRSAAGGVAQVAFDPRGAGLYVVVVVDQHVRTLYCHLSAAVVVDGQEITAGEVIGDVGATGLATGPHLHFEVQVNGRAIDPAAWLLS